MNPIVNSLNHNSNRPHQTNNNSLFDIMLQNNSNFRQFMEQNKGRTPNEIAQAYGIDINQLIQLAGMRK